MTAKITLKDDVTLSLIDDVTEKNGPVENGLTTEAQETRQHVCIFRSAINTFIYTQQCVCEPVPECIYTNLFQSDFNHIILYFNLIWRS